MNYGLGTLQRLDLKWNFFKFRLKRFFEKQSKIDLDKYVQDVVVIHLKKRKDRYKQMKREASRIKLKVGNLWERIRIKDGIDVVGKTIEKTKSFNPYYSFKSHYEVDPHPNWKDYENIEIRCSDPEAGCTMSHISVWEDIVKNLKTILDISIPMFPHIEKISQLRYNEGKDKSDLLPETKKILS